MQPWLGSCRFACANGAGSNPAPAHLTVVYAARLPDEPRLVSTLPVVARVCPGPFDYWCGLVALWDGPWTLVNVEHDMAYSDTLADELLACPHPLCTHAYRMHIPRTYWAHSRTDGMDGTWIVRDEEWANYSAIGFCKIAPEARVRPLERDTWRGVELQVNLAVRGSESTEGRWHVHWGEAGEGIEHFHR